MTQSRGARNNSVHSSDLFYYLAKEGIPSLLLLYILMSKAKKHFCHLCTPSVLKYSGYRSLQELFTVMKT